MNLVLKTLDVILPGKLLFFQLINPTSRSYIRTTHKFQRIVGELLDPPSHPVRATAFDVGDTSIKGHQIFMAYSIKKVLCEN